MKAIIKKVGEIMCVELEGTVIEVAQAVVLMDLTRTEMGRGDKTGEEVKEKTSAKRRPKKVGRRR